MAVPALRAKRSRIKMARATETHRYARRRRAKKRAVASGSVRDRAARRSLAAEARRGQTISDMMGSDTYQLDESVSFNERIKAIPELGLPDPRQDEGVDEQHLYSHGSFDTQASDPDAFKSRPPGSYYDAAPPSYEYE